MAKQVADRELCFPLFGRLKIRLQRRIFILAPYLVTRDLLRLCDKFLTEIFGDPRVQINISVCEKLLQRIVHGEHLGN